MAILSQKLKDFVTGAGHKLAKWIYVAQNEFLFCKRIELL